ncbi:MAG: gliding motility-associated C-terminal domain-containing protein, partial [Bacteroidales bacterium]
DTSKFTSTEDRYYRRVVYSGLNNTCKSTSVPIHLTRYFRIENNIIAADQTICSGSTPAALSGQLPIRGKVSDYTYLWQDSSKAATWNTKLTSTSNVSYSPAALTDSVWYRRIVNSSKCTDKSNRIVINVHKPVANNVASFLSGPGPDTTICFNAIPHKIKGSVPTGGTDIAGSYAYLWQYSVDGTNYNDISASGTLKDYQPGVLSVTTWFRRMATSGMCSSYSNSMRIIVLPLITGNTIAVAKSAVCYNTVPAAITSGTLTGGSGTYTYYWESSITSATAGFSAAAGTNSQAGYTPPALTVKTWFRRTVTSGPFNCCSDISNVVSIDILPLPTGIITSVADTTLCSGGSVKLRVTLTGSPNWTVIYNENSTQVTVSGISSFKTVISPIPSVSSNMVTFNYSLASVTDNNGCAATSLTGTRKANVYHTPIANAGPDDEICGPVYKLAAVSSYGTGSWSFPSQVLSGTVSNPTTIVKIDSSFTAASVSYWFSWKETNWLCTSKDSVKITFDNRIDTINAGPAGEIMTFDNVVKVDAYPLKSFESGLWSVVEGNGDFEDNTANSTYVRNIAIGNNIYKWTVKNGVCVLEDTLLFVVSNPVIPEAISPDGNNINDTLKISGLDLNIQDVDLKILNSAGTLVFSTSNRKSPDDWVNWTGKDSKGNLLPEGTYYYLLDVASKKTGHVAKVSGFIILKRH